MRAKMQSGSIKAREAYAQESPADKALRLFRLRRAKMQKKQIVDDDNSAPFGIQR